MSENIIKKWLSKIGNSIGKSTDLFLLKSTKRLSVASQLGSDACERLRIYCSKGKMLRGAMVILGYRLISEDHGVISEDHGAEKSTRYSAALLAASSMEMLQASLLIHDDIMDRSNLRRGQAAIHEQYRLFGLKHEKMSKKQCSHLGISLAICLGDLAQVYAMDLLSQAMYTADIDKDAQRSVMNSYAKEVSQVGAAQMDDVAGGLNIYQPTLDEIIKLYRHKTGRYTFSLPLTTGATIAGAGNEQLEILSSIGEYLGIIFQIRDDWIGIYSEQSGKSLYSDISENKKTIYRQLLFNQISQLNPSQRKTLSIFGAQTVTSEQMHQLHQILEQTGVRHEIDMILNRHADIVAKHLETLRQSLQHPDSSSWELLESLIKYSLCRSS